MEKAAGKAEAAVPSTKVSTGIVASFISPVNARPTSPLVAITTLAFAPASAARRRQNPGIESCQAVTRVLHHGHVV